MLKFNWITDKNVDFEYKKYILLAYLKEVDSEFNRAKLYPHLNDLKEHYKNLLRLQVEKQNLTGSFPKLLKNINLKELKMEYEQLFEDDDFMKEIEAIIEYSIPKFQFYIDEGSSLYRFILEKLQVFPIGIVPLYTKEGYMFLKNAKKKAATVFRYAITLFDSPEKEYQKLTTQYITSYTISMTNTYEHIKKELIRYHPELPNPATYVIESGLQLPVQETLLPVAEKALVKFVSEGSRES